MQKHLGAMSYYIYHIQCQSAVLYQIYQTVLLVKIKPIVSLVKESEIVDNGISVTSILIGWRLNFHGINSTVDVIGETTQAQT
jgi:hypothetical protein